MRKQAEKIRDVILAHAVGDALGVPVEFCERETLDASPVTDMMGFGTYPYPAGYWSDDTSMSLAALDSLCGGTVSWDGIMKNFGAWLQKDKYTPSGETFDAGRTCVHAIVRYFKDHCPATEAGGIGELSNGNGSLMRIHPFVLYAYVKGLSRDEWIPLIHDASSLTHRHERAKLACGIYAFVLMNLLEDPSRTSVENGLRQAREYYGDAAELSHYERIFSPSFGQTARDDIKSSGYVVDTLEAALWCLLTTERYRDCVLTAVNLGGDTDTVAAVAGGLAGALYGGSDIPREWLATLMRRDYITDLCDRAASAWTRK